MRNYVRTFNFISALNIQKSKMILKIEFLTKFIILFVDTVNKSIYCSKNVILFTLS